jgi:hypothetical protein
MISVSNKSCELSSPEKMSTDEHAPHKKNMECGKDVASEQHTLPVPLTLAKQKTQRRRSSLLFTPGHDTPGSNQQPRRNQRKRHSLTFCAQVETREIPRYSLEETREVFWTEAELNLMQCEANMRKVGMEPEAFDWKSFR